MGLLEEDEKSYGSMRGHRGVSVLECVEGARRKAGNWGGGEGREGKRRWKG